MQPFEADVKDPLDFVRTRPATFFLLQMRVSHASSDDMLLINTGLHRSNSHNRFANVSFSLQFLGGVHLKSSPSQLKVEKESRQPAAVQLFDPKQRPLSAFARAAFLKKEAKSRSLAEAAMPEKLKAQASVLSGSARRDCWSASPSIG